MPEEPHRKCIEHGQDIAVLKSEITVLIKNIERINEKLDRILEQTTKHNGRMDKIESDIDRNFECDEETKRKVNETRKEIDSIKSTISHAKGYGNGVLMIVAGFSGFVGFLSAFVILYGKIKGI